MRTYVPQRQTFPSIARTICSLVGAAILPNRAYAFMIMPGVQ